MVQICPYVCGERPGLVCGGRESEVLVSYQIAVSQQCSTAVRKQAACCRAWQQGGMELSLEAQCLLEGEWDRPHLYGEFEEYYGHLDPEFWP